MEVMTQQTLIEIFLAQASAKYVEALADAGSIQFREERDKQRKREKHEEHEREKRERLEQFLLASEEQLRSFYERLDGYDTATVHAIMDNEQELEAARGAREALEASAYRLPDGRSVFKSGDGKHVYDNHGAALSPDDVPPDAIPNSGPSWETFKAALDAEAKLAQERAVLNAYQARLDHARDAAGQGGMTADDLDALDKSLQADIPAAVKARLPGAAPAQNGPATVSSRDIMAPAADAQAMRYPPSVTPAAAPGLGPR